MQITEEYSNLDFHDDRATGRVQTPKQIIDFMISLYTPSIKEKILEPACGSAPFLDAIIRKYSIKCKYYGVEINPFYRSQFSNTNILFYNADFLLWNIKEKFDLIIGNPPYGIIGDKSKYPIHILKERKNLYKQTFTTWKGKYNIYGAFIEKAINLLNSKGTLIFITPASWLVLDDFSHLRKFLSQNGKTTVYYVGKCFKGRNVSAVIIKFVKNEKGLELYDYENLKELKFAYSKKEWEGEIIRFEDQDTVKWEKQGIPLKELFYIHFAARSPEIKKSLYASTVSFDTNYVPVLTGKNLKRGYIDYKNCYSGYYFHKEKVSTLRKFYSIPHIVVAHTKGTKVVSAYDYMCYPWREEFHLIPKKPLCRETIEKIVEYLNSDLVSCFIYKMYRNFVPHLTLKMLGEIPIEKNIKLNR